jgi:hypothetical protein
MKPMGEAHLAILRRHMVEIVDMHFELAAEEIGKSEVDPLLRKALLRVQRHMFVPAPLVVAAYQDTPLPIGFDKTVSQPFIAALMIELLGLEPGLRVLEIGTGLGYQAALMAEMGAEVWSVEVVEEFAAHLRDHLAPRRRQDDADREPAAVRRRDPRGGRGARARRPNRRTRSDWMKIERERGISVTASVMTFDHDGLMFNLLDTPGHEDFSEDTYRTLTAVDARSW